MDAESTTTAAEQVETTEPTAAVEQEAQSAEAKAETVGELLNQNLPEKKDESVPLAKFLEMKNENKAMAKQMKELQKSIEAGASKREVTADLKALSDKHGVDADFLQEFADAVRAKAEAELDERMESKLKPIEEKEKAKKIDAAFNEHYAKALEQVPEYEGIVNKDVIKTLSLNPANANKTFIQIIEASYGHLIKGERSLDAASSRAGKTDNTEVDVDRAKKDSKYFNEVMADPNLKKKYNDTLTNRLSSFI